MSVTRVQVKQELRELQMERRFALPKGDRPIELKYGRAIACLNPEQKVIFYRRVYLLNTYRQIGNWIGYSEDAIRKKWNKIIDKIINELETKSTNFDRITESVESFADWIFEGYINVPESVPCPIDDCETTNRMDCKKCFIEWLKKECEENG